MKRMGLGLAAVAILVAVALVWWFASRPGPSSTHSPQASVPIRATPAAATAAETPPAKPPTATVPQRPELAFERLDIDTSKPVAEACLIFSHELDKAAHYDEYLVLTPAAKPALRLAGKSLCLAGLAFGTSYQAELRAGFPAANGLKLANSEKVDVALRNRPPLVAFRDGMILPRDNAAGVPITSINIARLAIKLMRVPDRLLSQIGSEQFTERQAYRWGIQDWQNQKAAVLWQGEMEVKSLANETVTTLFPLATVLKDKKPGAYILVAEDAAQKNKTRGDDDDYSRTSAVQWVIASDIALTSFEGADGLDVFARSLARATPVAGLKLVLVARDNDELATVTTDADGRAHFDAGLVRGNGGATPRAVMAYGADGDFTFADVTRPAFDLSDRGVDGRALPGPVDAFVYTDRGIYRARETVHIVTLLRDRLANAMPAVPVTLIVRRPDGATYRRATLQDQGAGAVHLALALTDTAPHGHWSISAYLDPKGDAIGHAEFDVQDFIPQQLKVTVTSAATFLRPGEPIHLDADARFLYGAPAAGLDGESEATISADAAPFAAYRNFRFGLTQQKFEEKIVPLTVAKTDEQGRTQVGGALTEIAETTLPLKASIRVSIFEPGGRATTETLALPLRTKPLLIGIHPLFEDDASPENGQAAFEIVAVDETGKPVAHKGLAYSLVREVTEYTWYKKDNQFHYEHSTHDVPIADGTIDVAADKPAAVKQLLSWGDYRLTVHDTASGAATSYRFSAGWGVSAVQDRPDKAEVKSDKKRYAVGDTAHLSIRAPAAGKAMVVIASDRILTTRIADLPAAGTTVDVPVTAAWGTGAYAIVATYRALGDGNNRAPVRAIGLAWLPIDAAARTLTIGLGLPEQTLPRHRLDVPISIQGTGGAGTAYVTLAAVDEGILQLTKFVSPAPTNYYFGKRRLAVDVRDDYGRLIDARGVIGALRTGGDIGGRALDVVPTKTVALFSGPVALDAGGKATIPIDIPDFNGDLRFMAVAYDGAKVGNAEKHLIVRDPVVTAVTLPRFLAPGDRSRLSLDLHNLDGAPGTYHVGFTASGATALGADATRDVALAKGERKLIAVAVDGKEAGIGTIELHLIGPNFDLHRNWQIAVRSPQLPVSHETVAVLGPGKKTSIDPQILSDFVPGTGAITVTIDSVRTVPLAGLLRSLDRYPFGCVEQLTSRAYPLLYFNDVATAAGIRKDVGAEGRVQAAIDQLLDMQRAEGNFGLWAARGDEARDWLSVYALDFLTAAATRHYHIPPDAFDRGRAWLKRKLAGRNTEVRTRLYAAYVLARIEGASLPDLRYVFDTDASKPGVNAFSVAQIGAAMAFEGDRARTQAAFAKAEELPLATAQQGLFRVYDNTDYYGSALRDWAGFLTMAAQANESAVMARLYDRFQWVDENADDLTTQEKAWLLLAMAAITEHRAPVAVEVGGRKLVATEHAVTISPTAGELASGITITSDAPRDLWEAVSIQGIPVTPLPATSNGISLIREFWTLDGKPADLAMVKQNDRLVVTLRGATADQRHHEVALLDLLPAGFEIDGVVKADQNGKTPYPWLGALRAVRLTETRDDRFVASFVVHPDRPSVVVDDAKKEETGNYLIAYLVRAITPGHYVLPAAVATDMYRPAIAARTAMGQVVIEAR